MILQVSEVILVLLLSIIIIAVVPKIREIRKNTVKTALYILLGLILFFLVGLGYNVIQEINTTSDVNLAILYPYTQFYPLLILSIALAGVILVTYMEGERYGLIIAGTAFFAMAPDITKYMSNGRFDLFLLGCVVWALIPIIWVLLFRRLVYEETTMRERIWAAVSASLISYLLYVCTAIVAVFGEARRDVAVGADALTSITMNSGDILRFVVISLWFFILLTVISVSLMFVVHDLALHTFNVRRVVRDKKEIDYESAQPVDTLVDDIQPPPPDVYKSLVEEMRVFNQYFDQVDRLRAASTIARFKQEYVTLAARHDSGSKSEAEQLIKVIDQEFKKRY